MDQKDLVFLTDIVGISTDLSTNLIIFQKSIIGVHSYKISA
jgi:hypothetical protein